MLRVDRFLKHVKQILTTGKKVVDALTALIGALTILKFALQHLLK